MDTNAKIKARFCCLGLALGLLLFVEARCPAQDGGGQTNVPSSVEIDRLAMRVRTQSNIFIWLGGGLGAVSIAAIIFSYFALREKEKRTDSLDGLRADLNGLATILEKLRSENAQQAKYVSELAKWTEQSVRRMAQSSETEKESSPSGPEDSLVEPVSPLPNPPIGEPNVEATGPMPLSPEQLQSVLDAIVQAMKQHDRTGGKMPHKEVLSSDVEKFLSENLRGEIIFQATREINLWFAYSPHGVLRRQNFLTISENIRGLSVPAIRMELTAFNLFVNRQASISGGAKPLTRQPKLM